MTNRIVTFNFCSEKPIIVGMKLVTFEVETVLGRAQRLGSYMKDSSNQEFVLDLNAGYAWILSEDGEAQPKKLADTVLPGNMRAFLEMGSIALSAARQTEDMLTTFLEEHPGEVAKGLEGAHLIFPLSSVRLKTPLPEPNLYRDFYAFEQHVAKGFEKRGEPMPESWYQLPVYYKGNHRSIIGPEDPVIWPKYTKKLDYELELAVVIGKQGRNIPVERARDYIAGYTILNDFSARDIQRKEMQCRLGPAKGKDFASAVGPMLVTVDEVGDPRNLTMLARINGEEWSRGNSGTAHWTFEQMIAHVSQDETLYPGDILGSGTVGNGCGLELDRWLQPGDIIELEIENLGILRNYILPPSTEEAAETTRVRSCARQ